MRKKFTYVHYFLGNYMYIIIILLATVLAAIIIPLGIGKYKTFIAIHVTNNDLK